MFPLTASKKFNRDIPMFLAKQTAWVPYPLQSLVLERVLNQVFAEALLEGEMDFLELSPVKISIDDINLAWSFSCVNQRIVVCQLSEAVTTIRGKLEDFICLVTQKEDPDTLFFQRRLIIEGYTEVGLEVKNLFDSIDIDSLPLPIKHAISFADRLFIQEKVSV